MKLAWMLLLAAACSGCISARTVVVRVQQSPDVTYEVEFRQ